MSTNSSSDDNTSHNETDDPHMKLPTTLNNKDSLPEVQPKTLILSNLDIPHTELEGPDGSRTASNEHTPGTQQSTSKNGYEHIAGTTQSTCGDQEHTTLVEDGVESISASNNTAHSESTQIVSADRGQPVSPLDGKYNDDGATTNNSKNSLPEVQPETPI